MRVGRLDAAEGRMYSTRGGRIAAQALRGICLNRLSVPQDGVRSAAASSESEGAAAIPLGGCARHFDWRRRRERG